jgi:hypothetical protein
VIPVAVILTREKVMYVMSARKREAERRDCRNSLQDTIHLMDGWQYELNLNGGFLNGKH